jgi:UDP-2,4-diacetamido-2,4,6-trideoxy-beta-L-altropyranose hydrolase
MEGAMNIVFRVDSSLQIGTGHVMRCLTIAHQLKRENVNIVFICSDFEGNINHIIRDQGFKVLQISAKNNSGFLDWFSRNWVIDAESTLNVMKETNNHVDLMIIDHYGLDSKWESHMRPYVGRIMVIDDLANRPHTCDFLLDQNFYIGYESRYKDLVPESCLLLLGPEYALLRDEFLKIKKADKVRDGQLKRILVFFGGTDPTNETVKTLRALSHFGSFFEVDVIVGATNPKADEIQALCSNLDNYHFYSQVNNISEFMDKADLAIGAGGSTTWERCYLGLPSITIVIAENQKETTEAVSSFGATINLGESSSITESDVIETIKDLIMNKERVLALSRKSQELINPQIVNTYPVADIILKGEK